MDPSWGIVIVAVSSVAGAVITVMLQNSHSAKLAILQHQAEAKTYCRDRLVSAFGSYMIEIDRLNSFHDAHARGYIQADYDVLLRNLDAKEITLSIFGSEGVARAARAVSVAYGHGTSKNENVRLCKDALAESVRVALLDL